MSEKVAVNPDQEVKTPEPTSKKRPRAVAKPLKLAALIFERDCNVGKLGTGTTKVANMSRVDGSPVLVSMAGGGEVSAKFGVEPSAYGGYNVTFSISQADYDAWMRAHDSMVDYVIEHREEYFPGSSLPDLNLRLLCNKTATPARAKKEGNGTWDPNITVKVKDLKDLQPSATGVRKCKIKSNDGSYVDDLFTIPGATWKRAVVELAGIYITTKQNFAFQRKLKFLSICPPSDELEVHSDEDEDDEQEAQNATNKRRA